MRRLFAAFLMACLCCGQAGAEEQINVLLLGDSTTLSKRAPEGVKYSDWVAAFLSSHGKQPVNVINGGVGGATAADGLKQLPKHSDAQPSIIVTSYGLNDAVKLPPAEFLAGYEKLINAIQQKWPKARLFLATSTPFAPQHSLFKDPRFQEAGGLDGHLKKHYVDPVKALAQTNHLALVDQYTLIKEALAAGEKPEALIRPDGVHLTEQGNLLCGRNTALAMVQALNTDAGSSSRFNKRSGLVSSRFTPQPPDLSPHLGLMDRHLYPLLEKQLTSTSRETRLSTLSMLLEKRLYPHSLMPLMVSLLKDPDTSVVEKSLQWLQAISSTEIIPMLLDGLSDPALPAHAREPYLELLVPYSRNRNVRTRDQSAIPFTDRHLDILLNDFIQTGKSPTSYALRLLLESGDAGVEKFLGKLSACPEAEIIQIFRNGWNRQHSLFRKPKIDQYIFEQIRHPDKKTLAQICMDIVINRFSSRDIPVDLLVNAFLTQTGNLQSTALSKLLEYKEDAVMPLVDCLKHNRPETADDAARALLHLGFTLNAVDPSGTALAAAKKHFTQNRRGDFLAELNDVFNYRSRRTSRSFRYSPSHKYRLKAFVPFLETTLQTGSEPEKETARELIFHLWKLADDQRAEKARENRSVSRYRRSKPNLQSLKPVEHHYFQEAHQQIKAGDKEGLAISLRRVMAAGPEPSTCNSLAWAIITADKPALRDAEAAEKLVRQAIALGGRHAKYLDTLAACLAAKGQFKEALALALEAIQLSDKHQDITIYAARALLYLNNKTIK